MMQTIDWIILGSMLTVVFFTVKSLIKQRIKTKKNLH